MFGGLRTNGTLPDLVVYSCNALLARNNKRVALDLETL